MIGSYISYLEDLEINLLLLLLLEDFGRFRMKLLLFLFLLVAFDAAQLLLDPTSFFLHLLSMFLIVQGELTTGEKG